MHTLPSFRERWPEFGETSDEYVQATLEEAAKEIDPAVWLDLENTGHGLLTAHKLASSPFGNGAKLNPKDFGGAATTYERDYKRYVRMVAAGIRSI